MIKKNVVIFSVTDFCNAKCKTCSFWKTKNVTFPKKEKLKTVVENIRKNLDCGFLSVTGGEPLTYPFLFDLIKEARSQGMIVQLMTNGYLLNKNKINELEKIGLNFIAFSVDHYDEKIVFKNRELPNLLQKLKENIFNLKNTGIITQGGITLAKHNISDLEKIASFSLNKLGFDEIYFSLPIKLSDSTYKLGNDQSDSIDLSDSEIINAINCIIALKKKLGNKISHRIRFLKDIKKFYTKEKQKYPCKAGENIFFLDNHLNLYDCMVKNTYLGKITDSVKLLRNINCYDCPLQCFREGSIYLYGMKSIPFFIEQILNKNYWKLIKH